MLRYYKHKLRETEKSGVQWGKGAGKSLITDGHVKNCNYTFKRVEKFLVSCSLSFELSTMDDNRLSSRR